MAQSDRGRLRLDPLYRNGGPPTFFPWRLRLHSSRAKKAAGSPSSAYATALTSASSIVPGLLIAIEAAKGGLGSQQGEITMANIGSFKKSGNDYTGSITTLSLQAKTVRIVPEEARANDNAPSHRVFIGKVEVGAAWAKRSNEGRDYLGLKLDDPSFNAPIFANLFNDEDSDTYSLIWSRPSKRAD